jgi:hypothetical protein
MKGSLPDKSATTIGIFAISVVFYSFYCLGVLFPNTWWATHFIAFIPSFWKYTLLLIGGLSLLLIWVNPDKFPTSKEASALLDKYGILSIVIVTLFAGILINKNPIVQDHYGDAYKRDNFLEKTATKIPDDARSSLFSFSLKPWAGERTVLAAATYISYYGKTTYKSSFYLLGLVCGCLFVFCWLLFLRYYVENRWWRFILGLAGLTAPFMFNFFGHIEMYAPVLLFNLIFLIMVLVYLRNKNKYLLWALIPMLLLCLKVHSNAVLYVPGLGLLLLHHYYSGHSRIKKILTWKGVFTWLLFPIFLGGLVMYFFVFKDYNDSRLLHGATDIMEYDRMFLPIVSPPAPLDNYNLFSPSHLFDYFSLFLLWSPIAFFLLIVTGVFYRKQINWNAPAILFTGIPLILLSALFFVVNPLLSMQLDWDLFCLPATAFLLFTVAVISEIKTPKLAVNVTGASVTIALLCIPVMLVHSSLDSASNRLESVGIRMYHTYYEWSAKTINYAIEMDKSDVVKIAERRAAVLKELEPYALKGKDREYTTLLLRQHDLYFNTFKDYEQALVYCEKAGTYETNRPGFVMCQMETNLLLGNSQQAYDYAKELLELKHPSEQVAVTILLQCAIEIENFAEAERMADRYVKNWNDAPVIREIHQRLINKDRLNDLRYLFDIVPPNPNAKPNPVLLMAEAEEYRGKQDYAKVLELCQKVEKLEPLNKDCKLLLMESYFVLKQFKNAYGYAEQMVALKFPNEQQALSIAIHCALEAEMYAEAKQQAEVYLQQWDNQLINEVYNRLLVNKNVGQLKTLFSGAK